MLLGNGSSRAIWDRFKYESLFEVAQQLANEDQRLRTVDIDLFDRLGTQCDFEAVLYSLAVATSVMKITECSTDDVRNLEEIDKRIRESLIQAVNEVHIPPSRLPDSVLDSMGQDLKNYCQVFSLNYDLLLYWAVNRLEERERNATTDGFHNDEEGRLSFDPSFFDFSFNRKATRIYYLHGGIHLYITVNRTVCKHTSDEGRGLLSTFGLKHPDFPTVPLFVTEGEGVLKRRKILRSSYLSSAYEELVDFDGPVVIVGCSLGQPDRHLVEALTEPRGRKRQLAVSVYPERDEEEVGKDMRRHFSDLGAVGEPFFFDSRTHPFASPELRVSPEERSGYSGF